MKLYTISEAARILHLSEYQVKKLIKTWRLEVIDKAGFKGAQRLSGEDIQRVLDQRIRDESVPRLKIVATIGTPDHVDKALEISGLCPKPAANLLDAISAHYPGDHPVIITTYDQVQSEKNLYDSYAGEISVLTWVEQESLRSVVVRTWELVQQRVGQKLI